MNDVTMTHTKQGSTTAPIQQFFKTVMSIVRHFIQAGNDRRELENVLSSSGDFKHDYLSMRAQLHIRNSSAPFWHI
ncbi:MAG: hypothetical protein JKY10_08725 [Cohaesibacteraceae bacterium]|nr:hypothetical protein [Cohaesibacteraceae bacterium]